MPTLGEIMTKDPFTTAPATPVAEVAQSMVKGRFGSAVVLQGGVLVGIFTERDVLRAAASGNDLAADPVSRWMTPNPVTAETGDQAEGAAETMLSSGFRHLPVVDGNSVVGIVSLRDILSARLRRSS
jgi:CBS domain-containing protein